MLTLRVHHCNTVQSSTNNLQIMAGAQRKHEIAGNQICFATNSLMQIIFFHTIIYLPIKDVSDVAQLCSCIHKYLSSD